MWTCLCRACTWEALRNAFADHSLARAPTGSKDSVSDLTLRSLALLLPTLHANDSASCVSADDYRPSCVFLPLQVHASVSQTSSPESGSSLSRSCVCVCVAPCDPVTAAGLHVITVVR